MKQGVWKEQAFEQQMSKERDFEYGAPVRFKYAICCGHRTGSNLLGEALYKSGVAGDPMEFFNVRFLKRLLASRNTDTFNFGEYLQEIQARRTSPNGIFGINVKIDQLNGIFNNNHQAYSEFIKSNNFIVFLYRRDKLKQAVSVHIGQSRDLFNVPAGITDEEVRQLVDTVPFSPSRISHALNDIIQQEQAWLSFFKAYSIPYEPLAYEDFVQDYEGTIGRLLTRMGVSETEQKIPPQPMKKVSNQVNAQFRERFYNYMNGMTEPMDSIVD